MNNCDCAKVAVVEKTVENDKQQSLAAENDDHNYDSDGLFSESCVL